MRTESLLSVSSAEPDNFLIIEPSSKLHSPVGLYDAVCRKKSKKRWGGQSWSPRPSNLRNPSTGQPRPSFGSEARPLAAEWEAKRVSETKKLQIAPCQPPWLQDRVKSLRKGNGWTSVRTSNLNTNTVKAAAGLSATASLSHSTTHYCCEAGDAALAHWLARLKGRHHLANPWKVRCKYDQMSICTA